MGIDALTDLAAEPYYFTVTLRSKAGHRWKMPALQWLIDECGEFNRAGKLDTWLAYYGHFRGVK